MLKPSPASLILFTLSVRFGPWPNKTAPNRKEYEPFSKPDPAKAYNPGSPCTARPSLPGWGQATNKKYWKILVVYAALGTTTYISSSHNVKQYREARDAYINAIDGTRPNDFEIPQPYYSVKTSPNASKEFPQPGYGRMLIIPCFSFILFWGLNVVDATVDAHLKTFDVKRRPQPADQGRLQRTRSNEQHQPGAGTSEKSLKIIYLHRGTIIS